MNILRNNRDYFKLLIICSIFLISGTIHQTLAQTPAEAKDKIMERLGEVDYLGASKLISIANQDKSNQKDFNFQILCGDIFLEIEKLDSAYYYYKNAEKIDDDSPVVLRKIGKILSLDKKHAEAIKVLEKAINEDKKDIDSYLELADAYIRDNNMKEAELIINRAKNINNKEARLYITLGDMYFAQRVFELAKTNYEQALSLDTENLNAMMKLAESYYWLANNEPVGSELADELFTKCLQQYNQVTQRDPKNTKALFEQGKILFWSNKFDKAAQALYSYAQLRPDGSLGRWFLAQSLVNIGKCDSAASHLQYVSQHIDSVKVKSQILLAQCYFNDKHYDEAITIFNKVSKDTVLVFADMRKYATSNLFAGDTTKAIELFKEITNIYPDDQDVCTLSELAGRLTISTSRFSDASYFFDFWLNNTKCSAISNTPEANEQKSKVYYFTAYAKFSSFSSTGSKDTSLVLSALENLNKSIGLDPTNYPAYILLGDCYSVLGKTVESENAYNDCINKVSQDQANIEKNSSILTQAFGKICGAKMDKKDFKSLIELSKRWTNLLPESEFAWLYLALGYHNQGDTTNACKAYTQTLKINPNNANAKKFKASLGC